MKQVAETVVPSYFLPNINIKVKEELKNVADLVVFSDGGAPPDMDHVPTYNFPLKGDTTLIFFWRRPK